jgi:Cytochrome c3/Cytochrome c554 and c-prime
MLRPEQGTTKSPRSRWVRCAALFLSLLLVATVFLPRHGLYASYSSGRFCAGCHEIVQPYNDWHASTHRDVACGACHGGLFSLDVRFHLKNLHRVVSHARDEVPEQIRLKTDDVQKMSARCKSCHEQEYAKWAAGPHSATYEDIFLNEEHNRRMHLADDCLRCHGMHFAGGARDLITTTDTTGPWHLRDAKLATQPAIPCLSCHQVHRAGEALSRSAKALTAPPSSQQINTPSLALFDRRELESVSVAELSLPVMREGERAVRVSPDARQALCYECHAPLVTKQVGSGDDRTPVGVHEGISCLSCHSGHGEQTRASCATCHPRFSNCGLNVENMDTTFFSKTSGHNIHSVQCVDCHSNGVPKENLRRPANPALSSRASSADESIENLGADRGR